jgi:hypothetical protein
MKALRNVFLLLLAAVGLASCGGGGGGSQGAFQPTPVDTITISPTSNSVSTNSFTTLTVTVKRHDGTVEANGTEITASVTPSTIGTVSGSGNAGTTATNTLAGGSTSFNFNANSQTGTATITISVPAGTNGATTTATSSVAITVNPGNGQNPRLKLTPSSLTLPLNPFAAIAEVGPAFVSNFPGSPYIGEVTVTWTHLNGGPVSGTSKINVAVAPTTIIGFSLLDDPTTPWSDHTKPDGNEFLTILGSGPANVTAGTGTLFVHADDVPGTATLTVTAIDPDTGETISSTLPVTVAGAASSLPASISIASEGVAYVSGSNGPQNALVTATVTDGNDVPAADPNGFNNVQFSIAGPANADARLSGINAAGQTVSGSTINTVTHNGIASVTFISGSQQGPVQIKAVADRGDNNVDNGIQDAVSATTTLVVSDGKLFSLTLTRPDTNAISANSVSSGVTVSGTTPADPNATYSLTVSAIGTDRQGNPVLPGTIVKFGSIDAPQSNGVFSISGTQGNPQEGGTFFVATDGHFKTAGGGAGPGDTLIVFGKNVPGNADLESASKVTTVNNEVSLNVAPPFNQNDTTGVSVDNGYVLPYVVGRAQTGNISSPSATDEIGVASTILNYPVSALGRTVAIWAQSTGIDAVTGGTDIVTDAAILKFPGISPATITVSPNPIPGNITVEVDACIVDALGSPISGVHFNFSFQDLGVGTGKLDGITTQGVVPDGTDATGCVATTVVTTGIDAGSAATLHFKLGDADGSAPIVAAGGLILLARPSFILSDSGGDVTLTLLNSNGTPVPGVQLVGSCSGDPSIHITVGPGITDAKGQTTATIAASLGAPGGGLTGTCTFTTTTGSPSATVTLKGTDSCLTSPQPTTGCNGGGGTTTHNLTVQLNSASGTAAIGSVTSLPTGLSSCVMTNTSSVGCAGQFTDSTVVVLTAHLGTGATGVTWGGGAGDACSGTNLNVSISMTSDKSCTATFTGPAAP